MFLDFADALSIIRNMFHTISLAVVVFSISLHMKSRHKEILRMLAILLMMYSIGIGFLVLFNSFFYEKNKIFLAHNMFTLLVVVITIIALLYVIMSSNPRLSATDD